ncbi:hypothetical protein [Rhizobium phaseoli]|uniref:hypothetical protein n=1 Tax=Rhizobium phaseoli TaxID=396 RepID=UPI000AAD4F7B|nr:hypothetical protein [Rhizobium phaseoli]
MGDWTPEAEIAVQVCTSWAKSVRKKLNMDLFLFGSAIYDKGDQFDSQRSDLDLVAVFEPDVPLAGRLIELQKLHAYKADLETKIIPQLQRINCVEPGVSIVALTRFEVRANVHKSGARRFFDKNYFLNLQSGEERIALSDEAGTVTIPDENRHALEYVQKIRNDYLGMAANGTGGLRDYSGIDPMPKALLRFAAQVRADPDRGQWYDTRLGMEFLFRHLFDRSLESDEFRQLFHKVSVRRGGRGTLKPLSAVDQLHLAEVLYDISSKIDVEEVILWEMALSEYREASAADRKALLRAVVDLLPHASFTRPDDSLHFKMRSPLSTYEVARKLDEQSSLAGFLGVERVRLAKGELQNDELTSPSPIDLVPQVVADWQPDATLMGLELEQSLTQYLDRSEIRESLGNPLVESGGPIFGTDFRPDFKLTWRPEGGRTETCLIEVKRYSKSLAGVMATLEELFLSYEPTFLVVVGEQARLDRLRDETRNLKRLGTNVQIIFVAVDSRTRKKDKRGPN